MISMSEMSGEELLLLSVCRGEAMCETVEQELDYRALTATKPEPRVRRKRIHPTVAMITEPRLVA
ncbi:MAG TPA: hypothetical protein ENH84_05795 [Phycisphaerae bacterium]|uniref:Uncharacterized protein n=1 Tax=marine sediment metagenome TaxID=412755 RepID=A0A0F9AYV6_9ZZZZ|nr:hypothetical protein [Phycisphaerae bacterium]